MKGLLIKDFRLLKGQVYFLLIVTVCVIVFMINGSEAFGVAYVCSMVALLSLTTVSYDEYENGMAYLFTLPISENGSAFLFTLPITKKDYVKEKYLFAGILLLIGLIVSMIMWYITAVIKTGNIAWDDWMSCCIGGVTAGLMMVAVALPAQLKFGPERGRIALVTIVLLAVALGILMQEFTKGTKFAQSAKRILNQIDKLGTKGILGVIVIIWVIVGVISMIISMRVMEKREF